MKIQAIIPAAGAGTRLKSTSPKPLVSIKGKPLLVYALKAFEECPLIFNVIVVAPKENIEEFRGVIKDFEIKKVVCCVAGGKRRCDSVANGLKQLDKDTELVVIHDGARPFLTVKLLKKCILAAQKHKAVVAAVPIKPTVKRASKSLVIQETLKRDELWEIQTPQVFAKEMIVKAYKRLGAHTPTDDAQLVEEMGAKVKIVHGDYQNIKVTTKEDLELAEFLLSKGWLWNALASDTTFTG
ncbi:MAG: 2-C-methyl-D-erythritol 4-phosphate cytidylyltransferase [Candidatus Omnitrophica bacterium]|nr:2-C-methyl-D-erythritol 4-phosphate cytidylyltransferase [Candidatus Omnitrophota bacterium]